jgi:hypothetical protein
MDGPDAHEMRIASTKPFPVTITPLLATADPAGTTDDIAINLNAKVSPVEVKSNKFCVTSTVT